MPAGIQVLGKASPELEEILSPEALAFVAVLAREFEPRRRELMAARIQRQSEIDAGHMPGFLEETSSIRQADWSVAPAPRDLMNRRVELTGPSSNRRMVINALNSGAQVYMTDFEDAHSPSWTQTLMGQRNVRDASRRAITDVAPDGREYKLNDETSTLCVRPRGLHLMERKLMVDGQPVAGSFFDFGLSFFHNASALLDNGTGPYYYLPKLQSHLEAKLWNDVFNFAQDKLNIPRGTICCTVLIEHILAAFEMEEILYELREHPTGLNLGRWDYIFSFIKVFSQRSDMTFPDRAQVNMATHFLTSAAQALVYACHKRGAHALGGMSAYIPRRDDPEANDKAMAQVKQDKEREASQGFDGAWVAHPGLIPPVLEVFQGAFQGDNQLTRLPEVQITAQDLLQVPQGDTTEECLRNNISVTLQYVDAWIQGSGAVAIYGLMEDTATAEISRSQLWQWLRHGVTLSDGRKVTESVYLDTRAEEAAKLMEARGQDNPGALDKAVELLDYLVLAPTFVEFLTIPGVRYLE
ncbi:MAG: malate synthase A [SAR202 cluster bacterium Io17-Chloro-G9]|nr:MAG: malate synthase A [SAR202 cluster bacterium Io17-Chloro-G9]